MPVGKTRALLSPFQHILVRISSMKDIWSPWKGQHVLWDSSSVAPIQRQAKCSDLTDLLGLPGWIFLEKKKKKKETRTFQHMQFLAPLSGEGAQVLSSWWRTRKWPYQVKGDLSSPVSYLQINVMGRKIWAGQELHPCSQHHSIFRLQASSSPPLWIEYTEPWPKYISGFGCCSACSNASKSTSCSHSAAFKLQVQIMFHYLWGFLSSGSQWPGHYSELLQQSVPQVRCYKQAGPHNTFAFFTNLPLCNPWSRILIKKKKKSIKTYFCFGRGVGPNVVKSLPTSAFLWFLCDKSGWQHIKKEGCCVHLQ